MRSIGPNVKRFYQMILTNKKVDIWFVCPYSSGQLIKKVRKTYVKNGK